MQPDQCHRSTAGERVFPSKRTRATEWSSEQLFGPADEVVIRHGGSLYRLRRTKLGKLILTK